MSEATQAFNQNQFDVASSKYREALTMKPRSPEALNGLAGMLTKQQQYTSAALIYDQLTKGCSPTQQTAGAACSSPTRAITRTRMRSPSKLASRPRSRPLWLATPSICAPWQQSI